MDPTAADSSDSTTSEDSTGSDRPHAASVLVGLASRAFTWLDAGSDQVGAAQVPIGVDAALAVTAATVEGLGEVARLAQRVSGPVLGFLARPPLVPAAYQPATIAEDLARRGQRYRVSCEPNAASVTATLVRRLVNEVLDCLDLTAAVIDRVDLDAVIASVDIEAVVRRLDLTSLVLDVVDLDAVVAAVDVEAVVRRLDLTRLVMGLVDLDAIVATVDLDAILARADVNSVAERVDISAIIDRIDLVGLASYVIDEIDLPGVIRESTSGVASEAVRGVRMQSIDADQAVQRTIDRLLLRRKGRETLAPGAEQFELSEQAAVPHEPVGAGSDR